MFTFLSRQVQGLNLDCACDYNRPWKSKQYCKNFDEAQRWPLQIFHSALHFNGHTLWPYLGSSGSTRPCLSKITNLQFIFLGCLSVPKIKLMYQFLIDIFLNKESCNFINQDEFQQAWFLHKKTENHSGYKEKIIWLLINIPEYLKLSL